MGLTDNSWQDLCFDRWDTLDNWNSLATVKILDTTGLSIAQVASAVKQWIDSIG